jgi:3'-phosphoadenosine 5'-phosphosulfate sulfotransferase
MHTGSLKPMTVLVFDRNDKHAVETAMSRYFPGTGGTFLWMVTASGTSRASRATIGTVSYTSDEKYSASLITGSMAEVVSKDAGLRLPKDGFVVTLSEAPDWWAAKLKGFLKACGLG